MAAGAVLGASSLWVPRTLSPHATARTRGCLRRAGLVGAAGCSLRVLAGAGVIPAEPVRIGEYLPCRVALAARKVGRPRSEVVRLVGAVIGGDIGRSWRRLPELLVDRVRVALIRA
jgi:hypothetical protein